jgi:hypothetical protein
METRTPLVLIVTCIFLSSCASIINTGRQSVSIHSTPPGATILINDSVYGTTPRTVDMKRKKKDRVVKIQMDGYETYQIQMARSLSGWFFGNILIGGLIGMGIDALSGGMYIVQPERIDATLQKKAP